MATNNNVMREFEKINQSIVALRTEWETGASKPDKPKSYTDLWRKMNDLRFFMRNEYNDRLAEFKQLESLYNPAVLAKEKARFDDEYEKLATAVVSAFRKVIKELTATKHQQVTAMVRTPPTETMRMLLATLEMRDDLDAIELYDVMPAFFENYSALRALQSISRKNGINLIAPCQMDCGFMHQTIDSAADYLYGACDELLMPKGKTGRYNDFYTVNDNKKDMIYAPMYQEFVKILDYVPQLQDFSANKTSLTPLEQAKIDWYYRDVPENASELQLAQFTRDIMEKYPKDVALLKLSKYAKYLEIAQEAAK